MNPIHSVPGGAQNIVGFYSAWMVPDVFAGLLYRRLVDLAAQALSAESGNVNAAMATQIFSNVVINETEYLALFKHATAALGNYATTSQELVGAGQRRTG